MASSSVNVIAHNLSAMFSDRQLGITTNNKAKSAEKLGSGYRINRAADDAAGLSISEKMRFKIRGLEQGARNTQDGISFVQIGDGAMSEINDMLHRMTELSIKAANGTMSESDRADCDREVQQLKNEINRISTTTKFNTIPVFNNPSPDKMVRLSVKPIANDGIRDELVPTDLTAYNSTYDPSTGKASYGGLLFHGERIDWSKIKSVYNSSESVEIYTDENGVERFKNGGTYSYTNADPDQDGNNEFFTISIKKDDEVPQYTRNVSFEADAAKGIAVDGEWHPWSDLKTDTGASATNGNVADGFWNLDYYGARVTFEFLGVDTLADMADAINKMHDDDYYYSWDPEISGQSKETAVYATGFSGLHMTQSIAEKLVAGKELVIHAGDGTNGTHDGVWLEADGTEVGGSLMSWDDLGLSDWMNGFYVKPDELAYTWVEDQTRANVDKDILHFSFTLSDVTSKASVIAGLDNMKITTSGVVVGSDVSVKLDPTNSTNNNVSISRSRFFGQQGVNGVKQELIYGRDFSVQSQEGYQAGTLTYASNTLTASFSSASGTRTFEGSVSSVLNPSNSGSLYSQVNSFLNSLTSKKVEDALYGTNTAANTGTKTTTFSANLRSTSGDGSNITLKYTYDYTDVKDRYTVNKESTDKITADMLNGSLDYYVKDQAGAYHKNLGLYVKKEREVVDTVTTPGTETNPGQDVLELANASVDWENDKLYVYDEAADKYNLLSASQFIIMDASDPDNPIHSWGVTPTYSDYEAGHLYYEDSNTSAIKKIVGLSVLKDPSSGDYGSTTTTTTHTEEYFDPAQANDSTGEIYYKNAQGTYTQAQEVVTLTYKADSTDITNNLSGGLSTLAQNYTKGAINTLAGATSFKVNSSDYTKYKASLSANSSTAVRPNIENIVNRSELVEIFDGVNIQHSNTLNDRTWIPRFGMNAYAMGISNANCRTYDAALRTIDLVRDADMYVARKRSIYGGLQNRYEHSIKINNNTSENLHGAESLIRDTNMADEMVRFSNLNIIQQAGQSMLTQANQSRDFILSLLQ